MNPAGAGDSQMLMWHLFIYGFVVGFGAAVFPGPINLEVVRRAISRGPNVAIAFGMGAVTADVSYVFAISAGAAAVLEALPNWAQACLYVLGGVLLFIIGVKALRAKCAPIQEENEESVGEDVCPEYTGQRIAPLVRSYLLGLALTLGSPPTILYWLLISVQAAQHFGNGMLFSTVLAGGVFVACSGWVLTASLAIGSFHKHLNPRFILLVERVIGVLLILLSIYSVGKAFEIYRAEVIKPASRASLRKFSNMHTNTFGLARLSCNSHPFRCGSVYDSSMMVSLAKVGIKSMPPR